jgi:hypothetical protein
MVVRGRVQDGVVVLDGGIRLSEGQVVTVLAPPTEGAQPHSILDIPPVSLGPLRRPLSAEDDLLGEMLDGRS